MRFGNATHLRPKPLLDVAGMPLMRRTLLTARKAGLDRFTVVTGYCAQVLEEFLGQERSGDLDIRWIRNERWRPLRGGHCRLAVDFHPENIMDLADATKVEVKDGWVMNIGKEIERYNGIDTGIFLCSHEIFAALEAAVSKGNESLSDGIRELARRQRMEAVDIGELFWQDIDDEAALLEGERRLEQLVHQKDNQGP